MSQTKKQLVNKRVNFHVKLQGLQVPQALSGLSQKNVSETKQFNLRSFQGEKGSCHRTNNTQLVI